MSLDISIVVSTYNRPKVIDRFLKNLENQSLAYHRWEAVVIDDGSTEETKEVLQRWQKDAPFHFRFQSQTNQGQSAGRHNGIILARAPFIAIVDDDMMVEPEFLEEHLKVLRGDPMGKTASIGWVQPREQWHQYPVYESMREKFQLRDHEELAARRSLPEGKHFITQNVAFPKGLYLEVGGFDPYLKLNEDCELGYRFLAHGATLAFAKKARAVHHSQIGSFESWFKRQYDYAHYYLYVWRKYGRKACYHPLRHMVSGSRLNRWVVMAACPNDQISRYALTAIKLLGDGLRKLGCENMAINAYRSIQVIQLHRGLRDNLGSWRVVKREIGALKLLPQANLEVARNV